MELMFSCDFSRSARGADHSINSTDRVMHLEKLVKESGFWVVAFIGNGTTSGAGILAG